MEKTLIDILIGIRHGRIGCTRHPTDDLAMDCWSHGLLIALKRGWASRYHQEIVEPKTVAQVAAYSRRAA